MLDYLLQKINKFLLFYGLYLVREQDLYSAIQPELDSAYKKGVLEGIRLSEEHLAKTLKQLEKTT